MTGIDDQIVVNNFNEESAKTFREQVFKRASLDNNLPIVIYIDSYGGYIDSLNSMLDTLEQIPNQIVTVCTGKAMSCGAVLLAAGDFRYCGRNSRVMVHQGSSGTGGPIESLQNDVDESKRLNRQLMDKVAIRCGKTYNQLRDEMKNKLHREDDEARDLYLSPQAALEIGIVDYVGVPVVKPIIVYSIELAPEKVYEDEEKKVVKKKVAKKKVAKKKVAKKKVAKKKATTRKKQ